MTRNKTITLFRPVGQKEMDLIKQSNYRSFPPRLPYQPIFYPVLTKEYAIKIAQNWNTKDAASGYTGYVTQFKVKAEFLTQYTVQTVGSSIHQEYWIPAEHLTELNQNIVGNIQIIAQFKPEKLN